ncbi:zinc-binding dehydrogenase [Thioclava sp. BHET1]|nr:zinc-binding dehydrogenase [Thioclava sp. BHET1]
MQTRVCRLHGAKDLRLETTDLGQPGAGEVLVAPARGGICGSDLHYFLDGGFGPIRVREPIILGHEAAGTVLALGPEVTGLAPGDRVALNPSQPCGTCRFCAEGLHQHCLNMRFRGSAMRLPHEQGMFADRILHPAGQCVKVAAATSFTAAACAEPLAVCLHALHRAEALLGSLAGKRVLVTGAGPIGIMAGAVARHVGARHVVITDVNPDRLRLAAEVADIHPVNVATEDLRDVMARLKMKEGFDVGLEMSGNQAALDQMVEALVMGGRIALLGIPPGKSPVDWSRIVFKAITIKGVYGREIFETWYKMIAMLQNGLDIRRVITHRFAADDFAHGFAAMRSGQSGKVVLDWG